MLASQLDNIERDKHETERRATLAERKRVNALDATLDELNELTDLLVKATLLAAGFHQHNRGNWRKRRGTRDEPN